jgi:hypothetical protein
MTFVVAIAAGVSMISFPARADNTTDEAQFFAAINAVRATHGVAPLAPDGQLISIARAWSSHMASTNTLAHNPSLSSQVSNWQRVGENVGMGATVASIEAAFEASPHHFENMVNPAYQYLGVGVVEFNGTIWVTEDYKQAESAVPTVQVPKQAPPPSRAAPAPRPAPAPSPAPRPAPAPHAPAAPAQVASATAPPAPDAAPAAPDAATPPAARPEVLGRSSQQPAALTAAITPQLNPVQLGSLSAAAALGGLVLALRRLGALGLGA